jgi:hypothetical protein
VSRRFGLAVALAASLAVSVPAAARAGSLLAPYQVLPVGSWPEAVAIGDVTGDGRNDVVMTTSFYFDPLNDFRLWVFPQAADGTLSAPESYATDATYSTPPASVAIGDVTGDGRADVVVGVAGLGVETWPQLATGDLGTSTTTPTTNSGKIRLGQLDGDGRLDVAGVGWGTDTVSVLLNDGAGGFLAPVDYPALHAGYEDLEVADVTGDGRDDLVVMSGQYYEDPNISVLPQLATGGFGPAAGYRVAPFTNTQGIGVGDVTGDGRNDVVASYGDNSPGSALAVFAQTDSGTLAAAVSYPSYDIPEPVDVADVDLDGRADAVTLHGGWLDAGVYRQLAGGALAPEDLYPIPYASHYNPHGLAVGDVSGDGSPDVVLGSFPDGLVVLRNTLGGGAPPAAAAADLGVGLTASAQRIKTNRSFSFAATVTNGGPDASSGASLGVSLSGPASAIATTAAECSVAGLTVTCSLAGPGAGASRTVQVYGTATARGTIAASAVVHGREADPNAANDQAGASIQVR